jgi:hypothetical protein
LKLAATATGSAFEIGNMLQPCTHGCSIYLETPRYTPEDGQLANQSKLHVDGTSVQKATFTI